MVNEYSAKWFSAFLETMPEAWTRTEVEGIVRRLPLPAFRRVLDICCGPGRHAGPLARAGYEVTGVDRDVAAVTQAAQCVPGARFVALDQRRLGALRGPFDAAMILWQSFGYFDPATNDRILGDIAAVLRPGGRLLLDVYHPGFVRAHTGTTTTSRSEDCRETTNIVTDRRLVSTISYVDGSSEAMDFELLEPDDLAGRAARHGFRLVEACCWWDRARPPTPDEHRYQLVLELAGPWPSSRRTSCGHGGRGLGLPRAPLRSTGVVIAWGELVAETQRGQNGPPAGGMPPPPPPVHPLESVAAAREAIASATADVEATMQRASSFPDDDRHRRMNDEWSTVQSLRHIVLVIDLWLSRVILGQEDPFHPIALPPTFMPPKLPGSSIDPDAQPSFDEACEVLRGRMATLDAYLDGLTQEELERPIKTHAGTVGGGLDVLVTELRAHNSFINRDLDLIEYERTA